MKRTISIFLTTVLLLAGMSSYIPLESHAMTVEKTVTKYHLDIGVQHIWGTGKDASSAKWQNGYGIGSNMPVSVSLEFPVEVSNVEAYPLYAFDFEWKDDEYNHTKYLNSKDDYNTYYRDFVSNYIDIIRCSSSGKTVQLSYKAKLSSTSNFDLKEKLNKNGLEYIFDLLGGEDVVYKNYRETYDRLVEGGEHGIADNVFGFMYFTPVIIQYDVKEMVEIGGFAPDLDLPATAKQGEKYTVSDATDVDKNITIDHAVLEKHYGDGNWQHVTDWKGPGKPGENTGGSVLESCNEVCTITYRLTVWDTTGQVKSVKKSINITDGREINGKAILQLPSYTYEGHPALAEDLSEFEVDGVYYSSKRAYEEKVAINRFVPVPSGSASVHTRDKTTADITFTKRGFYDVRLEVRPATGGLLTDTKPIEVRKTPEIVDNIGGFQKQNRKQTLSIAVATYPGKPITDYYIELKDLKTNQSITLTAAQPQVNNATIKTRTIKSSGDEYWTNFDLEFLTKNTTTQDYRYTVYVKDSKGDTDSVQKDFAVVPDLPPVPKILLQDSFLRNKGTNIAEIKAEDSSTTDGDQLARTWTVSGTNVKSLPGYEDQSFGSGQKVKYDKTGVGKETIRLTVQDVWTEPTLEEYITNADRLSATTTATTEVINIAPVVSLEPMLYKQIGISLLVDQKFKSNIDGKVNSMISAFLEKHIDPSISVAPVQESYDGEPNLLLSKKWKAANMCSCGNCHTTGITDSEYTYIARRAEIYVSGGYDYCRGPLTVYAFKGEEVVWSYTSNEVFTISEDQTEKYILLHKDNSTILLNRNNGAYVTAINQAIGNRSGLLTETIRSFVSPNGKRLYFVEDNRIMKYDSTTNTYTQAAGYGGSFVRLQDGRITFLGKTGTEGYSYYIGQYDMEGEELKTISLPKFDVPSFPQYDKAISMEPVGMDASGKLILKEVYKDKYYNDLYRYAMVYLDAESKTAVTEVYDNYGSILEYSPDLGFVKDETGKAVGIYRLHLTGDSEKGRVERALYYRDIKADGTIGAERVLLSDSGNVSYNEIIYAEKHTAENKIYIVQGTGETYGSESTVPTSIQGFTAVLDLKTGNCSKINSSAAFGGMSAQETETFANGNLMASTFNTHQISGAWVTLKQIRRNLSGAQAEFNSFQKYVKDKANDLVYYVQDGILNMEDLFGKVDNKIDSQTSVKVKISGGTGTISKKVKLEPNNTYYCEYAVKSLTSTGAVTAGTSQTVSKATASECDYVITDENFEDFTSAADLNSFFSFSNKSKILSGRYSESIYRRSGKDTRTEVQAQRSTISFTVPAGKKAVLSFDYIINLSMPAGVNGDIWQNGFLIDGERWAKTMAGGSGHYTHPLLLGPGNHTIEVFSQCYADGVNNHTTSMDNLSVAYVAPKDTMLPASGGNTQQFVVPKDGPYTVKLYGPGSDGGGGLVEADVLLKKNDVLTFYLGPEAPGAKNIRNGANGADGNGYGSDGLYLSKVSLNGRLIMIAGGGGSNGNLGTGDGGAIGSDSYKTEREYQCGRCGDKWGTGTYSTCPNCRRSNTGVPIPCAKCGATGTSYHYHYYYNGIGGKGGKAGAGGASTATAGSAGDPVVKAHWELGGINSNNYGDSGAGGKGGRGGASWADSAVCKNVKLTAGTGYGQAKANIVQPGVSAAANYGIVGTSESRDNEGWITGKTVIKAEPTVMGYSSIDYLPLDYDRAFALGLISRSATDGISESFAYTVPEGKVSLKNQVTPRLTATSHSSSFSFGYSTGGTSYIRYAYKDEWSAKPYAPIYYIDSLYKFTEEKAYGTHSFSGVGNSDGNKNGSNARFTYFDSISMNLMDNSKMNSSIDNERYFFNPDSNKVAYANTISTNEKTVTLTFDNQGAGSGEYLIKDLKFYYIQNGKKVYVNETNNDVSEYNKKWTASGNVTIAGYIEPKPEEPEDPPLVYKKGQLVAYNIFYDDYEKDPSKKQYWKYTHTPFNDGPHPQAAVILDENGNVVSSNGTILPESIPRFYIDGKYTVEHWQEDNTNRTGDTSGKVDYSKYDKPSNVASITFYIEGGGTAPWINSIKTIPATVKEGDQYRLQIGVDDAEKDELRLTTELYKDKKLIYTHKQNEIKADASGNYPLTTTGYPPLAEVGKYEVVCTVRDWSGAGIGAYKYIVVSEGKITGAVTHTADWEENRKKYNLKRFSDEINRSFSFADYLRQPVPRKRGINVFWSGEKFVLNAETEGRPSSVKVQIMEPDSKGGLKPTGYSAMLSKTEIENGTSEKWQGDLWDKTMINKWGGKQPEELTFAFTAYYSGGITKTHQSTVIIDSDRDYWQLHRLW